MAGRGRGGAHHPAVGAVQTVYNMLEPQPGSALMDVAGRHGAGVLARVPTRSGLLEGNLTTETRFRRSPSPQAAELAHRGARDRQTPSLPRARSGARALTQAAIQFVLACNEMSCVLPTVTDAAQLSE